MKTVKKKKKSQAFIISEILDRLTHYFHVLFTDFFSYFYDTNVLELLV